jgi:hypothetical protein
VFHCVEKALHTVEVRARRRDVTVPGGETCKAERPAQFVHERGSGCAKGARIRFIVPRLILKTLVRTGFARRSPRGSFRSLANGFVDCALDVVIHLAPPCSYKGLNFRDSRAIREQSSRGKTLGGAS